MDIVKQLKLQLDDATESDPDVDNVKCIISPIYEDYFNAIEDEQLEDVDMAVSYTHLTLPTKRIV